MDTREFTNELLQALSDALLFDRVALQSEGPVVSGRAFFEDHATLFLHFYYNSLTGTLAFALIKDKQRIWGIDYDNRRGWHLHPLGNPTAHQAISPMSILEIVIALHELRMWPGKDEEE